MRKVFVDTNIIIDALVPERPEHQDAQLLLALGGIGEIELWTSPAQWTDMFYILTQGEKRILVEGVKATLREVRNGIKVCVLGETEIDHALKSDWRDFEDAVLYQSATAAKYDAIITRDQDGFETSNLPIMSCAEYFELIRARDGISYADIAFE